MEAMGCLSGPQSPGFSRVRGVTGWVSSPVRNEFRQSRMRLGPAREKYDVI